MGNYFVHNSALRSFIDPREFKRVLFPYFPVMTFANNCQSKKEKTFINKFHNHRLKKLVAIGEVTLKMQNIIKQKFFSFITNRFGW